MISDSNKRESSELGPQEIVEHFFRREYARLVASLTRKFGVRHFELVEDVVQSSLERALVSWSLRGTPPNPSAWLYRVASNHALDVLRRDLRWGSGQNSAIEQLETSDDLAETMTHELIADDLLRMIFVCCDDSIPIESQIALALKTLCGFGIHEIARALLISEATAEKRITRAKERMRKSGLEPDSLSTRDVSERLSAVQTVIYLLFNEGWSSTTPDKLIREELCEEAVRLAFLLANHPLTSGPQTAAFMALLLFHAGRLEERLSASGSLLLLGEQDRSRWDRGLLDEGFAWFRKATVGTVMSRYHAEAWIAAEHCLSPNLAETDWDSIIRGYDLLIGLAPSPIYQLNRAIAIMQRDGPQRALDVLEAIERQEGGSPYYLWHVAKGEMKRRLGMFSEAIEDLAKAIAMVPTDAERNVIERRIALATAHDTREA